VTLARHEWPPSSVCSFVCLLLSCIVLKWLDISCPTIPLYPHLFGHMPFCPPVEALHAVTIMSLKAGLQLSLHTVLTSRHICQFSPNFSRTTRSEAFEKWEGKDLFTPPCIEIWRGIRPPCTTPCSTPDGS